MISIDIHGTTAQFTAADGWRCHDAIAERLLRAECTPPDSAPYPATAALALAMEQYGRGVTTYTLEAEVPVVAEADETGSDVALSGSQS